MKTISSWLPKPDVPLDSVTPTTVKSRLLMRIVLPIRSVEVASVPQRSLATVGPMTATFANEEDSLSVINDPSLIDTLRIVA